MIPPSGEQFEIFHGDHRATIVEVGGGVRTYEVAGRPVLDPYPVDVMCDGAHGAPLIPWPNRLADGRYGFDGADYQVALTEPEKRNAIHGLMRWRPWQAIARQEHRIVMAARLFPLKGWPFPLDLRIGYELGDDGLTVRTTATNLGDRPCPYACGHHPYLSPGAGLVDDAILELPAAVRILTDNTRQLPTRTERVDGTDFDFRQGRPIGGLEIDFSLHRSRAGWSGKGMGAAGRSGRPPGGTLGRRALPDHRDLHRRQPGSRPPTARAGDGTDDRPAQRSGHRHRRDPPRARPDDRDRLGRPVLLTGDGHGVTAAPDGHPSKAPREHLAG